MAKELTVEMSNVRRVTTKKRVTEDAQRRANKADTMLERIKILCEEIGDIPEQLKISHN